MLDDIENELRDILAGEFSMSFTLIYNSIEYEFSGIYDKTYLEIDNEGASVMSNNPQIGVPINFIYEMLGETIDLELKPTIIINEKTYTLKSIEDDGQGFARFLLKN